MSNTDNTNDPLEETVSNIIVERLGVNREQVTRHAKFIDDLCADSLDTVELIMAFEEKFGMSIPEEDSQKLTSVGAAIDYLRAHGCDAKV